MRITPINMAEAIIEPFWDPALSGLASWHIAPGDEHGLQVRQNWCWVNVGWTRRPAGTPALYMRRECALDITGNDTLTASVMAPAGCVVRLQAETDAGVFSAAFPPAGQLKEELALPLPGARRLHAVTLEIDAAENGVSSGWLNWIGLQNSELLPRMLAQRNRFDARWDGYLQPEGFVPAFTPSYGLLVNAAELDTLREKHREWLARDGMTPFVQYGEVAARYTPEEWSGDFVNFWGDTRYNRVHDHGKHLLNHGVNAAIAGVLTQDAALLRLAARYGMSLAMCDHWDDGMICDFPGGTFDHRCFVQSLCCFELALLLDLAGEMFTDLGRRYILQRLAKDGIGNINFNTWAYEYIHHCNQLAWFTPGRMLAYLVLERHWPRAARYTEIALDDLRASLELAVLPDGGYVEGPTYFRCVGRDGGIPLYVYARARGKAFADLLPASMKRCADFGEAIYSTDDAQDMIPICDGHPRHDIVSQAVMAVALPDSAWARMYRRAAARPAVEPPHSYQNAAPNMADQLLAWRLQEAIPGEDSTPAPFIFLPEMGIMASTRRLQGEWVKLFVMGNKAGAGHTHEDKGSFVLEFAGETFAMDPGTCDYSNPLAELLQHCERHNMLVPVGMPERPAPQCPLPADVKPNGRGDDAAFAAEIDAAPGWERYFHRWTRAWESSDPAVLIIRDAWELARGAGVEWYWQTQREVAVQDHTVVLTGARGRVILDAPGAATIRLDRLPLLDGGMQTRVALLYPSATGRAEVRVHLERLC